MNKHLPTKILILILTLLIVSCSIFEGPEDISNPLDPNGPDFIPPEITFLEAPSSGEIIDTCLARFVWEGNQANMNFSFRLDDSEWSEWSSSHETEYPLLDEGEHAFSVKSRYFNGVEGDYPQLINFTVDDLSGPAIACYPRYSLIPRQGSAQVEVIVHDVVDLAMIKVLMSYNPDLLTATSVQVYENASFLAGNGGTVIPFYSIYNSQGMISIEVAVDTGNPNSVSGTGAIAAIQFLPRSTQSSELIFDISSELRAADNTTIQIIDFGNGGVYVQ